MPRPDAIVLPKVTTVEVRLDPAQVFVNSMMLLIEHEELSGLNPWVYETAAKLSKKEMQEHTMVILGLYYAVLPNRFWNSIPAYLDHLGNTNPVELRDQVLDFYLNFKNCLEAENRIEANQESLLADADFFLKYLTNKFGEDRIMVETELAAFELLNDPPRMRERITTHLNWMWEEYYQAEWDRIQPMLEDTVLAFEKTDFSQMGKEEAAKYITGQDLKPEFWEKVSESTEQFIFVPSAHTGPYLGGFHQKNAHGIIFGARLPQDTEIHAPDLSRNEITIRLSALADDIRLNILKTIAEGGEMRSQEIIEHLDLSQSAASRHLKQLSATGYLIERRCSGAKCYSLNRDRVQDTMRAVEAFLLCD
jgi:DNA-binding transcriptional ArsR family regulator